MGLEREKVKELVKKANMIRYDYDIGHETTKGFWWGCDYLNDYADRKGEVDRICGDNPDYDGACYNLKHGVYLYRLAYEKFELFAIITDKGIKEIKKCSKSKKKS